MQSTETAAGQREDPQPVSIWPGKLRAFGWHLGLSAIIFAVVMALILLRWYPGFHFFVDGGWQGMRILAGVDLVLGPLLTLLIFDTRKSRRAILFDLCCIGAVQLAALIWGVGAIHSQRVGALAFSEGALRLVYAKDLQAQGADFAELRSLSSQWPPVVYLRAPRVEDGTMQAVMESPGLPYESFHELYRSWPANLERALAGNRLDLQWLRDEYPAWVAKLKAWLDERGRSLDDTALTGYQGRNGRRVVAFDRHDGRILGALPYYDPAQDKPMLY